MEFIYPAAIKDDGTGNLLVTFRDIPFAATEGVTMQEALTEAQGCLETAIASCIKDKEDIPTSSGAREGEYLVRLPAQTAAKTALYIAVKRNGITKAELGRRMGINEREVRRMLDPWHPTKLPRIEDALSILGYHLCVSMMTSAA